MSFDPAYADSLDNPERRRALPIREVLHHILSLPMERKVAVDVGAGTGYLTIPLSWIFKRVYAIEANPRMAKFLAENLEKRGVANVEIIPSKTPPKVPERPNLVVFSLSLHEIDDWRSYLGWAVRADHVLVIEWCPESERGPSGEDKIPREELIGVDGFELVLSRVRFPYYVVVLRPTTG